MDAEDVRDAYSLFARVRYQVKRYLIVFVFLIPSIWILAAVDPTQEGNSLLILLVTKMAKAALSFGMALLFSKFAFPKLALSEEIIHEKNIAAAILFAAIVLGVVL